MASTFDVHVASYSAASARVGILLRRLGDDPIAVIVEPVDQRPNGGILLIFNQGGVIIGPQDITATAKIFQ